MDGLSGLAARGRTGCGGHRGSVLRLYHMLCYTPRMAITLTTGLPAGAPGDILVAVALPLRQLRRITGRPLQSERAAGDTISLSRTEGIIDRLGDAAAMQSLRAELLELETMIGNVFDGG